MSCSIATKRRRYFDATLSLRDNLAFGRRDLWNKLFEDLYSRAPDLPCFPHNLQLSPRFKRKVLEKFGEARLDELVHRFDGVKGKGEERLQRLYEGVMDGLGYSQNRSRSKSWRSC